MKLAGPVKHFHTKFAWMAAILFSQIAIAFTNHAGSE
jgi:hypothetical protein